MQPSPFRPIFISAHVRARIVKILLIVGAIVAVLSLLIETISLAIPPIVEDQELGDNPSGVVITLLIVLIAIATSIIYIATVVFYAVWLYRAHANLSAFDNTRPLDHSPGWAVGSFFVPFVNLVVPYRAVKEVWQRSAPPDEVFLSAPSPPAWLPIWWTFWILASIAGNISFRVSFNENVPQNTATMVSIVAGALFIIASVLAYVVVDDIDKRQEETSGKLGLGKFSGPPPPPFNSPMSEPFMRQ